MTNTPMTPDREQEIRSLLEGPVAALMANGYTAVQPLLASVDRLRAEVDRLSDELTGRSLALHEKELDTARLRLALASAQRGRREQRARVAELEAAPVDEAVDLAEGLAGLEAMRREHPAPCRVPDSPDCTCVHEHPMDRAARLGATRIPEGIVIELCEAANTGRPTGWHVWADRDGEIWEVTDAAYDGDTVLMPCAGDMEPMLRRDVEKHFGPLTPKADW